MTRRKFIHKYVNPKSRKNTTAIRGVMKISTQHLHPFKIFHIPAWDLEDIDEGTRSLWRKRGIDPCSPVFSLDEIDSMKTGFDTQVDSDYEFNGNIGAIVFAVGLALGFYLTKVYVDLMFAEGEAYTFLDILLFLAVEGVLIFGLPLLGVYLYGWITEFFATLATKRSLGIATLGNRQKTIRTKLKTYDFYDTPRTVYDKIFHVIAYSANKIHKSSAWDEMYDIQKIEIRENTRGAIERLQEIEHLHIRNEELREDIPDDLYKGNEQKIEGMVEELAKKSLELYDYAQGLENLAKEYRKISKLSDATELGDKILDAMAKTDSSISEQKISYSTQLEKEKEAVQKVVDEYYESSLIFRPDSQEATEG